MQEDDVLETLIGGAPLVRGKALDRMHLTACARLLLTDSTPSPTLYKRYNKIEENNAG